MRFALASLVFAVSFGAATLDAGALWQPSDVTPARAAALPTILAANAHAAGTDDPRLAQRRERWTYMAGQRRIAVSVAVRDADFRTSLNLDGVMEPFVARFAGEIAAHWTVMGRPFVEQYLEGDIEPQPNRVARFTFANPSARDLIVGGQVPTTRSVDLAMPFDGIIGTDILANFDLYIDYDNSRLGLRR